MHILQISPQLPYPPDSGGRVAIYNILKHLSRQHDMTLATFVTEETEPYISALEPYCRRIIAVKHRTATTKTAMLLNMFTSMPYTISKYYSPEMAEQIAKAVHEDEVDLVHIDHLHMAQYVGALPQTMPAVLREHNVESTIMRRFAEQSVHPFIKLYANIQSRRLHQYEGQIASQFDRCVAVTEVDGQTLRDMMPDTQVDVVPDGVDTDWFNPDALEIQVDPLRLVTTGDYGWAPTADGLMYFVQEIFPLIREKRPDITFSIVGRQPPDAIQNMNQGIEILGRVEDVRPEIMRGAVFVAPTRIGSGIRLKILEAMALQRPVVSTSVGCEGIDAESETHLLIADDPASFAASVIRLLEDEAFRTTMTGNAARLIEKKYTWHALARELSDTYEDIVRKRKDNG